MKLNNRHILRSLFTLPALLIVSVLTSCGNEPEPAVPAIDTDDITVSFRLSAGNAAATRASEEYGTVEESYIDLNNLKILIFDKNQKLKQVLYDDGLMPPNTSLTPFGQGMYILKTKLDPQLYSLTSEFAILALANWRSLESDTKLISDWKGHTLNAQEVGILTISDLRDITFTLNPIVEGDQPDSWMPGNGKWIPMFGSRYTSLKGYDASKFNSDNPMPIPDVQLLRAFSKIEVENLDTGDNSPTIDNITLSHRNIGGRLMQDFNFNGYTANVVAPTIPADVVHTERHIPFHKVGNRYSIYLPEMTLADAASRQAICVNIDMNGVKHQKWIYLAPYNSNGEPVLQGPFDSDWDAVKRNYIYRYTINSLAFEFLVDVKPWIFGGKVHIPLE